MSIDDLVKSMKKIELLKRYLRTIQELQGDHLSLVDKTLLINYSKQLRIYLKFSYRDLRLIKKITEQATDYNPLSDAERLFIQELEERATTEELEERDKLIAKLEFAEQQMTEQHETDKNEIKTLITQLDDSLDTVMYETFMSIDDIKRRYEI